ncbi:hypothetical protein TL16_g00764 [Triparma laevis f. inornata]|uniref:Uncharacterized protein n=1 Tax=Triparma laevis f. inornata TaxID=1714386 RepID=A0A9W6ZH05_9STRA|nr:hypothetical protein TL16_g00764 [Triparma laevis f. inornata]
MGFKARVLEKKKEKRKVAEFSTAGGDGTGEEAEGPVAQQQTKDEGSISNNCNRAAKKAKKNAKKSAKKEAKEAKKRKKYSGSEPDIKMSPWVSKALDKLGMKALMEERKEGGKEGEGKEEDYGEYNDEVYNDEVDWLKLFS